MCNTNCKTLDDCNHAVKDERTELVQCGKHLPLFCPHIIERELGQDDYDDLFG